MTTDKLYHIYIKDDCVLHSLDEDKFRESWELLNKLVGLMKTDYVNTDLTYEAVTRLESAEDCSY